MELKVIGLGLGRTGTYSLKTALEQLQLGPCHHMEGVAQNMSVQLPLWNEVLNNPTNFEAVYKGMQSAVDWATAAFYEEPMHSRQIEARPPKNIGSSGRLLRRFGMDCSTCRRTKH